MDTKFSNMKKLFVLYAILFSTNVLNAQTIQELEGRYTPPTSNSGYTRTYHRSGWDDFVDAFTPEDQTWGLGYSYSQTFPPMSFPASPSRAGYALPEKAKTLRSSL